jgi:hypothetical protein
MPFQQNPSPLPDRVVLITLLGTVLLCFSLVLISVRHLGPAETPLQWRQPLPTRDGAPQAQVRIWTA